MCKVLSLCLLLNAAAASKKRYKTQYHGSIAVAVEAGEERDPIDCIADYFQGEGQSWRSRRGRDKDCDNELQEAMEALKDQLDVLKWTGSKEHPQNWKYDNSHFKELQYLRTLPHLNTAQQDFLDTLADHILALQPGDTREPEWYSRGL